MIRNIFAPLTEETTESLSVRDIVLMSGSILVARDAAHKRMYDTLKAGEKLPFSIHGETIFYAGPTPTPPWAVIGSIGPTTSGRMDSYTPFLLEHGLRAMIGKGFRSKEVIESIKQHKAVYFGATGGVAVLLSDCVSAYKIIAYEDLGPEAVLRLDIKDMPLVVLADSKGKSLY